MIEAFSLCSSVTTNSAHAISQSGMKYFKPIEQVGTLIAPLREVRDSACARLLRGASLFISVAKCISRGVMDQRLFIPQNLATIVHCGRPVRLWIVATVQLASICIARNTEL